MTTKRATPEMEFAAEQIIQICQCMKTPNDAFALLSMALQVVACMSTASKEAALAGIEKAAASARADLNRNYHQYLAARALVEARAEGWERHAQTIMETLVEWVEGEPQKGKDKTKH